METPKKRKSVRLFVKVRGKDEYKLNPKSRTALEEEKEEKKISE